MQNKYAKKKELYKEDKSKWEVRISAAIFAEFAS